MFNFLKIEPRVILWQYEMKTSVVWIIRIYQVDYLWVKSQANVCLRGVWKLGTFNDFFYILLYRYYLKRSEKMSYKGHWKIIEFHSWISVWTMSGHKCLFVFSESGPIVDYDKNHPLNVTLYRFGYDYMNITWEMPPDQNNTDLMHFQVYYMLRRFKFCEYLYH